MGDPILSQDEINALMRESSHLSPSKQLVTILSPAALNVVHQMSMLIPYAIEMDGHMWKHSPRPLDTVFGEEVYIVPADMEAVSCF